MTALCLLAHGLAPVAGPVIDPFEVWVAFTAVAMPILGLAGWLIATGRD